MGVNLFADGNTCAAPLPATERVEKKVIKAVEAELIYQCIPGQRNWGEVFREVFAKTFPYDIPHIDRMVSVSLQRLEEGYVPTCVMDAYRERIALHARYLHK